MTLIYEIPLQHWIGSTDVNGLLTEVGGWHVGSYAALGAAEAVAYAVDCGWVQKRTHYFPDGTTAPAYELTDDGLERLRKSWGPKTADRAAKTRQWYRDRAPSRVA